MSRWHARLAELRALHSAAHAPVQNVQIVQTANPVPKFERFEQIEQRTGTNNPAAILDGTDKGDAPRKWAEALARLDPAQPPADVPDGQWRRFIDDCEVFLDSGWAGRAAALGWVPLELFGCDRAKPFARVSRQGLLWLLNGRPLLALTGDIAAIASSTGGRLIYYRRPAEPGQVLVWELAP
jgi:hypothetical protein